MVRAPTGVSLPSAGGGGDKRAPQLASEHPNKENGCPRDLVHAPHRRNRMTERTAPPTAEGHTTVPYIPGLADVPAARASVCFIAGEQGILANRADPLE